VQELVRDLIKKTNEEHSLYAEMLDLAEQKRQILIKSDTKSLDLLVDQEDNLVHLLQAKESERFALQESLAEELECEQNSSALIEALRKQGIEEAQMLEEINASLTWHLNELVARNRLNMELTQQALEWVRFSMDLFGKVIGSNKGDSYKASGKKMPQNTSQPVFVNRQA